MSKNIGILGFGVVGQSTLRFLVEILPSLPSKTLYIKDKEIDLSDVRINVWDEKELSLEERSLVENLGAHYIESKELFLDFLESNDYIVVSPGVDLRDHSQFSDKWICELDLFSSFCNKTICNKSTVAITGTLGKTTITSMIGRLANLFPKQNTKQDEKDEKVKNGGNIGKGMLELMHGQEGVDLAVLELSSFQLEHSNNFAPDIALWTNFYPNHLDRHSNLGEYFDAKWNIVKYQKKDQVAILPTYIFEHRRDMAKKLEALESQICFVSPKQPDDKQLEQLKKYSSVLFYAHEDILYISQLIDNNFVSRKIFDLQNIPKISFVENWIFILSTLCMLGKDLKHVESVALHEKLDLQWKEDSNKSHRMELFTSLSGVDFYNDSKATVIQATKEAFNKLDQNDRPIILIMGGLGKGVDRSYFLRGLPHKNLKRVFCFGEEGERLGGNKSFVTLEETVKAVFEEIKPGDQVLFSPGGSSFDLFKNYKHRGDVYKELISKYGKRKERTAN